MKNVLAFALTLAVTPAFAATLVLKSGKIAESASVKMKVSFGAVATTKYSLTARNVFTATRAKATGTGSMSITMDGKTETKIIPPQNTDEATKGTLKIVSNSEIEYNTDGGPARLKATIVRDAAGNVTSVKVSDKEMLKAANSLLASSQGEQIRALQANPALAYAVIELSGMNCQGQGQALSCDTSMKVSMGLGQ